MITSSGKQNDNEVETSIVHLMQMHVSHRGIAEVKMFLPSWPALPDTPLGGPWHLQFFFSSSVQLPCGQARKCDFSGNAGQSNTDSHYDSQIDPYISCILIKCVCSRMQHKC